MLGCGSSRSSADGLNSISGAEGVRGEKVFMGNPAFANKSPIKFTHRFGNQDYSSTTWKPNYYTVFLCRFQDFDTVNKLWNTSISLVEKLTSEILVVSCTVRHYTFFCTFRHHTFPDVPPGAGPAHWMNTQGLGWNFRPHRLSHFSSSICFMT